MTYSKRRELVLLLRESDPDYVVDVLDVSSAELMAAFPEQLRTFLDQEVGEAGPDSEEPETFDEIDEQARLCEDGDDDA